MSNRTKTRRLPVYAEFTDEPDHVPDERPILDKESTFNFWLVVMVAIAALGSLGLMWGWFKTPSQALTDRNQKLEQQLAQTQADLETLKACLGK